MEFGVFFFCLFLSWNEEKAVQSHLFRLLGFLLCVPCVPVFHTSLLLGQRSEQAVYERGRRPLQGRYSPMALGGGECCWVVKVPDGFAVSRGSSLDLRVLFLLPGQSLLGRQHTNTWMDAWGRSLQPGDRRWRRNENDGRNKWRKHAISPKYTADRKITGLEDWNKNNSWSKFMS